MTRTPTAPVAIPRTRTGSIPRMRAPEPSLTEELNLLGPADLEAPTEGYDRTEPTRSRRPLVIAGCVVGLAIAVVVVGVVIASDRGASPKTAVASVPEPAPRQAPPPAPRSQPAASSTATPQPPATQPPTPQPSAPQPPAVAQAPAARPAKDPHVGVRVVSIPAGASVTLVDAGVATVIGTTPVTASLDPSRSYDLVFALPDHLTSVYHLGPHETAPLTVDLGNVVVHKPQPRRSR